MHEVILRFRVREAPNREEAVEMAVNYFCGGDNYQFVEQMEPEVTELPDVQNHAQATTT